MVSVNAEKRKAPKSTAHAVNLRTRWYSKNRCISPAFHENRQNTQTNISSSAIRTIPSAPESHRNPAFRLAGSHKPRSYNSSCHPSFWRLRAEKTDSQILLWLPPVGTCTPPWRYVFNSLVIITLYIEVFNIFLLILTDYFFDFIFVFPTKNGIL